MWVQACFFSAVPQPPKPPTTERQDGFTVSLGVLANAAKYSVLVATGYLDRPQICIQRNTCGLSDCLSAFSVAKLSLRATVTDDTAVDKSAQPFSKNTVLVS